jgi:hypothetical protein
MITTAAAPRSQPPFARAYDRAFDWAYVTGAEVPPPADGGLVPVYWDGLDLNTGEQDSGLFSIIENVDGWLDSPPLDGHDAARQVADGAAWGQKTLGARVVTLTGAAAGPRDLLGGLRDQLAVRAANRQPADLTITDSGVGRALTASVRAGAEAFRHSWLGSTGFRWQVTLTAADPALYAAQWQQAILSNGPGVATGRAYAKAYGWQYAAASLPNAAQLANDGNWPAPVYALYDGDLTQSTLTDEGGNAIKVAALAAGMEILIATDTLSAVAAGGLSRASYVLPGSVPMLLPAQAVAMWHLFGTGLGQISLAWRSAWV